MKKKSIKTAEVGSKSNNQELIEYLVNNRESTGCVQMGKPTKKRDSIIYTFMKVWIGINPDNHKYYKINTLVYNYYEINTLVYEITSMVPLTDEKLHNIIGNGVVYPGVKILKRSSSPKEIESFDAMFNDVSEHMASKAA